MRVRVSAIALLMSTILGCSEVPSSQQVSEGGQASSSETEQNTAQLVNQQFAQFKETFLETLWQYYPDYALYVGYYKYDDKLIVPNAENTARAMEFARNQLKALEQFDTEQLIPSNVTDLALIKNQLESWLWYQNIFKAWQWDPSEYNVAGPFGVILNTDYKPLDERLLTILTRLKSVPDYYLAAQHNITLPTLEHTDLAILQNKGALGMFTQSIPESVKDSTLSDQQKAAFTPALENTVKAITSYIQFLEDKKPQLAKNAKDFRIGKELYEQKFAHDIYSDYNGEQLYQKALVAKAELHAEMIRISDELWPSYFSDQAKPEDPLVMVKQMIDHLSVKHVAREDFVDEVRRQMPIIEQFIIDHDLLDTDPTRPLVVRETPEYQRGFAGASVDAPGPYDATANTYYNVTPLDDYSNEEAESYLREYNHWILQILNIHEAMPGHYTQLVHANKSASKIKSILANGAMVEGWAVYSERMMLEQGYANNEPEMWLMYSKWNLRVVVNTIIDYGIQVLGMSEEEVMDLLVNQAFQEQTEASEKWRRATLSQVQLSSYFSGYAEIYEFRETLKQKLGDKFDLKTFHNKFLSYGNAPVPLIKKMMLQELGL